MCIKLTHRLSCMAARIHLTIAKSLCKKGHSVRSNVDDHRSHVCNSNNDGKWLFSHHKAKGYEKRRYEREKLWKKHFATFAATQNWMPRVIILQFLFTDTATVNWPCAAMHDSLCVTFMHTWKRTFCYWNIHIFNVLY